MKRNHYIGIGCIILVALLLVGLSVYLNQKKTIIASNNQQIFKSTNVATNDKTNTVANNVTNNAKNNSSKKTDKKVNIYYTVSQPIDKTKAKEIAKKYGVLGDLEEDNLSYTVYSKDGTKSVFISKDIKEVPIIFTDVSKVNKTKVSKDDVLSIAKKVAKERFLDFDESMHEVKTSPVNNKHFDVFFYKSIDGHKVNSFVSKVTIDEFGNVISSEDYCTAFYVFATIEMEDSNIQYVYDSKQNLLQPIVK